MRLGMISLFLILYIAIISLFIIGFKKKEKKLWGSSLIIFLIAVIFTIIIATIYA